MTPQPAPATPQEHPTHARYWVVVFAITLAILSYLDRVCMSQAAPFISRELHLSRSDMGKIFGAFGLAYALFEIPSGWLGDRLGPRRVLIRIVLWWSTFTAISGWMFSFGTLWISQFFFGAGEAGGFPNLTKAFTTWLPRKERPRAQGIMWTFARWAGAFTAPLFLAVLGWVGYWRWAFVLFAIPGLIWALCFYLWFRDDPREHPGVNAAELAIIGAVPVASGHGDVPWRKLVSSRSVVLLWVQYFCLSFPWYFYITWLPTYLRDARLLSPTHASRLAILPLFCGGLGALFSGLIAGKVARWTKDVRRSRRLIAGSGFVGAFLFLMLSIQFKNPNWAMLAMGMASFCNDLVMPPAWTACMDIGGKFAGTVSGSMNMMGNLAGFAAPVIGGYILQWTNNNWNVFLYTMAAFYLIGATCWPWLDSVTPLEAEPSL